MKELWDAYDSNFHLIDGITLTRGEPLQDGIYHLVCEIVVKHEDGSFLLMKRCLQKKLGGMWELSAGGAAQKGETPEQCAKRELYEETGITADIIREIGYTNDSQHAHFVEFLCLTNCDKNSIVLQDGETIDYQWVSLQGLSDASAQLAAHRILQFIPELVEKSNYV